MIEVFVNAIPIAQPRARATTIGGHARMYEAGKDHPIAAFKASVRLAASGMFLAPLQGPLRVDCTFVFPRPKSMVWKSRDMPRARHVKRNDLDNLAKSVFDALNGLAYLDDAQISETTCIKWIASGYEGPHVLIRITELS